MSPAIPRSMHNIDMFKNIIYVWKLQFAVRNFEKSRLVVVESE